MTALLAETDLDTRPTRGVALRLAAATTEREKRWALALPAEATLLAFGDAAAPVEAASVASYSELAKALGADRFGVIDAVIFAAGDATEAEVETTLKALRAIADQTFHDAEIHVDWSGSEDAPCLAQADLAVVESSDWRWGFAAGLTTLRRGARI